MAFDFHLVADRLEALRLDSDLSREELCQKTATDLEQYEKFLCGEQEFTVTFLYKCADVLGVDLIEILTGEAPKLRKYAVVRKDRGLPLERRKGFHYQHLAYLFKGKLLEPVLVDAPFYESKQSKPVRVSSHEGQEFLYILSGTLKFVIDGKQLFLHEGDAICFDASSMHGMIAAQGMDCRFLSVLVKKSGESGA